MFPSSFRLAVFTLATLLLLTTTITHAAKEKDVLLFNEAGVNIDVYWVHPQTKAIHRMTDDNEVTDGTHIPLKSFASHEFEIHEAGDCGSTGDKTCRRTIFQVSPHDDQSK